MNFTPTHTTKHGFGGLLNSGIKVELIKTICEIRAVVLDVHGNIWHGSINDLNKI